MKPPGYYSLLIEVVIDGEATEAERHELFDALATDAGLCREFDEAVQFSATLASARAAYTPPPELAAAVFADAGIAVAPIAAGFSVMQTGIALVVGAMLTASLFLFPWKAVFTNEEITKEKTPRNSAIQLRETPRETLQIPAGNTAQHNLGITNEKTLRNSAIQLRETPRETLQVLNGNEQSNANFPENSNESSVVTQCNDLKAMAATFTRRNRDVAQVSAAEAESDFAKKPFGDYRFWLRGMMGMQHFPERPEVSNLPLLNAEGAMAIFWQASPTQSIGLEAGLEEMPLYVVNQLENGGTQYELAEKNYWVAGWYRNEFDVAGIPFYGATGLGASEAGPLAKVQAGLLHSFSNNFHGLLGVEFTQQFYRNDGQWRATQRLALTLSVGIKIQE